MTPTLNVMGKEFRHMRHDPLAVFLTLCLPVLQLLLYGYALETRIRHVPAALINRDTHQAGRLLERRLRESSLFTLDPTYGSPAEIQRGLQRGDIRLGIEIPPNYSANLLYLRKTGIHIWLDGADPATSASVLSAFNALNFEQVARNNWTPKIQSLDLETQVLFNPQSQSSTFLIPGLIAILMQTITVLLMAFSITAEREKGTLEQMLATPLTECHILFGKALAIAAVTLAESTGLMLLMRYWFVISIQGATILLVCLLPLLVLAPLGIGLLIAAKARTQAQALQLANLVLLPSVLFSGFLLPREYLRFPVDQLSRILPSTYLLSLTRNIVLRGTPAADLAPELALTAAFSVALIIAGYVAARRSLRA